MRFSTGSKLGPYEIVSPLGAGGMGEVYRARDPRLGRDVAVKVLPETVAGDPERLARFEREARALAALNHPNIVTIHSVEEAVDARFLTMELVEGESLDSVITAEGLSLGQFFDITIPIADALSTAHERGIVHRDLKPANVMMTPEGRIKVLDFGLAKLGGLETDPDLTSQPTETRLDMTREGHIFGTVAYMSPEQARGARIDSRSDIFSFGVVLYHLLTGQRPFHGEGPIDLISSILRDQPLSVTELRTDVPTHLGRILRRCLEKHPQDRYQSSRDVYNELKDLRAELSQSVLAGGRTPGPRAKTARSEELWIVVLPFRSSGSDAELQAAAEGLAEDITTGLARFSYLRVIARDSVQSYQGRGSDVRGVGRDLGARYALEGSMRRSGSIVRVTVQLIDTATGAHLWAEKYDRDLAGASLFAFQDEVTSKIVSTVADTNGVLTLSMGVFARSKPAETLSPYEAVLRSLAFWQLITPEEHREVRTCLERAVEQASDYADAWASLALMYIDEYKQGFNPRPDPLGRARAAAARALELDPANQLGFYALAQVYFFTRDIGAFRAAANRAIALNPLDGSTMAFMGLLMAYSGDWEHGVSVAERAMALNPHHPGWYWLGAFHNAYRKRDYAQALETAEKFHMPGFFYSHVSLAAVNGQLGRVEAARAAVGELLSRVPDFADRVYSELGKWQSPDLVEHLVDGLRKAGLEVPQPRRLRADAPTEFEPKT